MFSICTGIPYPDAPLADARTQSDEYRKTISDGNDPTEAKRKIIDEQRKAIATREAAQRADASFRSVFDRWRATDLPPRIGADGRRTGRKDGGRYTAECFERHVFPAVGKLPLAKVGKAELMEILDTLKAAGSMSLANHLLADLKQLYRFAAERDLIPASPIQFVEKKSVGGKSTKRDRYLDRQELELLPSLLDQARLDRRTELAVWLILATGVRAGELVGATWSGHPTAAAVLRGGAAQVGEHGAKFGEVNLLTRKWHIEATKNERDHTIHLSAFAVQRLEELRELQTSADWIFPATNGTHPLCLKSITKQLTDRQRTGKPMKNRTSMSTALVLPGGRWTCHDLRRTTGTTMQSLAVSDDVMNECLNHKPASAMTRTYGHDRRLTEQVAAFDKLGALLTEIKTGTARGNVIAFPAKAA